MKDPHARPGLFAMALLLAVAAIADAAPGKGKAARPAAGGAGVVALEVEPAKVELWGPKATHALLATAHYADGTQRDVTALAAWSVDKPSVARAGKDGALVAVADGTARVVARWGGRATSASVKVADSTLPRGLSFANDIVPVLTKMGCNSGACHGSPSGRGGFRLSMFGYDPEADYDAVTKDANGRRIDRANPAASLLLRKPTMQEPHGGGLRFKAGSPAYQRLERWLKAGAPLQPEFDPRIVRLAVHPAQRVFAQKGLRQRLVVSAHFDDSSVQDVTRFARFSSNDDEVAAVDEAGQMTSGKSGETAIMVRYLGRVGVSRVTVLPPWKIAAYPKVPVNNVIDERVLGKLRQLRIVPSDLCTDAEFLRRVTLDTTGRLPTVEEARAFLADRAPGKRPRKIDELLASEDYVDFWTLKWADLLRNNARYLQEKGMYAYHAWIRDSVARNKPYDRFARELLLAQGSTYRNGPANFFRMSRTDLELAAASAQVFMGIRIECARCHNHPFESWSQNDFYGLAAFFSRIRTKRGEEENEVVVYPAYTGERAHPKTNKPVPPRPPGGYEVAVNPDTDRRLKLVEWLISPENPYFARAAVNRLWAACFGRGIVHPVDDFRVTNPPVNEPLLETLAKELVTHQYDLKHVLRLILNSRTYQLSSQANRYNAHDGQNFSRALVRRLSAEQLFDAIGMVTGVPEKLGPYPVWMRAVQVPDNRVGSYFLDVFGRPRREVVCECERTEDASLTQALQLINGPLNARIAARNGRLASLLAANKPTAAIVEELYLAAYSRPPTAEEVKRAETLIAQAPSRQEGCEDLLWALLNTKEFLFNH